MRHMAFLDVLPLSKGPKLSGCYSWPMLASVVVETRGGGSVSPEAVAWAAAGASGI